MNDRVRHLKPPSTDVGQHFRLGHTAYKQFADWAAAGTFAPQRVVANPAYMKEQADLLKVLAGTGTQIVLDTKGAELAMPYGSAGRTNKLPWAKPGGIWTAEELSAPLARKGHVQRIARIVAEHPLVSTVMVPTHYLAGAQAQAWQACDRDLCEALRLALDAEGARNVALAYPLVLENKALDDIGWLLEIAHGLRDLPVSSIWLRVSSVGASMAASGLKRTVEALDALAESGLPLVIDYAGGVEAMALCSVGAASGFAHGIAMKEQFRANSLSKARSGDSKGGRMRAYLAQMQTYIPAADFDTMMNLRGIKHMIACSDTRCCGNQPRAIQQESRRHCIVKRQAEFESFVIVPEHRRPAHLIETLERAESTARRVAGSKALASQEKLTQKFTNRARELARTRGVIEQLERRKPMPVARAPLPPIPRQGSQAVGTGDSA